MTTQHTGRLRTATGFSIWLMADYAAAAEYEAYIGPLLVAQGIKPFPLHIPLVGGFTDYQTAKRYLAELAEDGAVCVPSISGSGFDTDTSPQSAYLRINADTILTDVQGKIDDDLSETVTQPLAVVVGYRDKTGKLLSVFDIGDMTPVTLTIPYTSLAVWDTTGSVATWSQRGAKVLLREVCL